MTHSAQPWFLQGRRKLCMMIWGQECQFKFRGMRARTDDAPRGRLPADAAVQHWDITETQNRNRNKVQRRVHIDGALAVKQEAGKAVISQAVSTDTHTRGRVGCSGVNLV
jgi:hypothetical protein